MIKIFVNKYIFSIFAMSLIGTINPASGQVPQGKTLHVDRETIQTQKNAFITAELGLTPEEAAAFIPLSEELEKKKFEMNQQCRKLSRGLKHKSNLSDEDYTKVIQVCLDVKMQEAQLEKDYYTKFSEILSPEKLYKYRAAELKFARSLFGSKKK